MNGIRICACCDDSLVKLVKNLKTLSKEEIANYVELEMKIRSPSVAQIVTQGITDIILNPPNLLGESGKYLIKQCINFLLVMKEDKLVFPRKDQSGFHKHKYIAIWSFIYDYLKVKADSGFDYFIMAYLDTHDYLEHGTGIRCGWLSYDEANTNNNNYFKDYMHQVMNKDELVIEEFNVFRQKIIEWGETCPDEM